MRVRVRRSVLAGLGAVLAVAGCSSGTTAGTFGDPSPTASHSSSAAVPRDFSRFTATTPTGFTKFTTDFAPLVPLETTYQATYFIPTGDNPLDNNIVSVFLYTLPDGADTDGATAQRSLVESYNTKLKATVYQPLTNAVVAGREGFMEGVRQPPNLKYSTWFAFGTHHFVQLGCQFGTTAYTDAINTACSSVLASLAVS